MSPPEPLTWPSRGLDPETDQLRSPGGDPAGKKRSRRPDNEPGSTRRGVPVTTVDFAAPPGVWVTRVVRSPTEFEALGEAWSALLAECAEASVFLSHEWLHSWWSAYRPRAELAIVLVQARGQLRAIAPLMIETVHRTGVRLRVLRFIGDGTGETDHIDFVTAKADRAATMPILLDHIATLKWDVAEFNQVPEYSPTGRYLMEWIGRRRLRHAVASRPCPVRRLPATYEELLSDLPSRLRTSIRSSRKKLQQKHAVEFGEHRQQSDLDEALATLYANHASRWQGKGQAGAFADERRRDFYRRLTPLLLARGWLRFFYLKLDGRTVAQQYCFALDGRVMLLQEGFDFSHAVDNVGNVLRANVFEHLIMTGAECYDFLAGASRHKASWSDGVVNDLCIRCAQPSWRGWLFFSFPMLLERARAALRPWRDRLLGRGAGTAVR